MKTKTASESGQVIVIIALAMVGLLAITALTVDGGSAFSDRRHAQNAADTSALASALAYVRNQQNWLTLGMQRAASNGYDNNGMSNVVEIYHPPASGIYTGNNEYVQVIITSHVQTYFGKVIGIDQITNVVQAVARAIPSYNTEMFLGNTVIGLSPHDCKAVKYQGSADTTITGGGIFVNSDCPDAAFFNNSSSATLNAPSLTSVGGVTYKPGSINIPSIITGAKEFAYPPREIVMPNISCSGNAVKTDNILSPGNWSGTFPPNGVQYLESGAYCVDGEFRLNGGDTLIGHDVIIYLKNGGISWNGGATVQLDAPNSGPYKGLLIYMPSSNSSPVTLNGNSSTMIAGTILAPAAPISVLGTGGTEGFNSQIIGYTVDLAGNSDTKISYNDSENWDAPTPPSIELVH